MDSFLVGLLVFAAFVILVLVKTAVVVPQRSEYVVERLGKYRATLAAGFHVLIPFIDKVAYRRNLKEEPLDIPSQTCITADNVTLEVDGVLYMQVVDSRLSAYGIADYHFAAMQLAQTSLRSAIGSPELGRQGAALRDPGHPAADERVGFHGKADEGRARQTR